MRTRWHLAAGADKAGKAARSGCAGLQVFGENLWIADGADIRGAAGFHFPTRMAIIRLADGGLFIWSPIALDPGLRKAVDALGPVRFLIAPNRLHHVFLADWMQAYPDAIVHGAPGLTEKRGDIRFHAILGDTAPPEWGDEIDQVSLDNRITPEIVFFHRPSRTVLFTDLLQQMPRDYYSGWRRVVARLDLMTGGQASVPRKFRLGFANRKAARAAIGRILAWPMEQVVMAHGIPVRENAGAVLRRAFAWLRV
ncbi:MAG: DUF4336 domain-containing protein [Rhodobacteraceae bacterium]|nr:DUF4336 domain-containing protein [Paracoccaceae bacterium]